jgi:DNA-binding phage protein
MPKRTASYDEWLIESLKDPQEATAYLNQHLTEDGEDADELFLIALSNVAAAYGLGLSSEPAPAAPKATKSRSEIRRLIAVIRAIGLQFSLSGAVRKTA